MDDVLVRKVTKLVSLRKINFPKISEHAPLYTLYYKPTWQILYIDQTTYVWVSAVSNLAVAESEEKPCRQLLMVSNNKNKTCKQTNTATNKQMYLVYVINCT